MVHGSKDICKLQGWETWGDAKVTAGCLPCVDVDHELGDNTGNIQHAWDQDSKAKGYFQFSFFPSIFAPFISLCSLLFFAEKFLDFRVGLGQLVTAKFDKHLCTL